MDESQRRELQYAHNEFFEQLNVDPATGWVRDPYLKFASYPHIGSRYDKMKRLMIVGMDIGDDTTPGKIHTYDQRRKDIENFPVDKLNPHMSGTYITAMHFLADECNEWRRWLEGANLDWGPQRLLNDTNRIPIRNPLSYIAFTNYYKFLLFHNGAKVQLKKSVEEHFLKEEARILKPDIIVLQSAGFRTLKSLLNDLSQIAEVFVGYHPSVRGKKRRLGNFMQSIKRWP